MLRTNHINPWFGTVILSSLSGLFLCLQAGCSIHALGYTAVNSGSLKGRTDILLIDPNEGPYSIEVIRRSDGSSYYWWEIDSQIEQAKTCRVKYHALHSASRFMVVEGTVGRQGKKYPIVLDTGASQAMFVKDSHVLENKLAIYPMETKQADLRGWNLGLCHLPELQIGEVTLVNWPCLYLERQMKPALFGLSIGGDNSIIVGLPALREFKYILFDNVRGEVEFSNGELFEPGEPELWARYPLLIEEDLRGNAFVFVQIPIGGKKTELQLDTGSGRGLAISEKLWEEVREGIGDVELRNNSELYPYIGRLACKRGVIGELEVGERTVKNAKISVFPSNSPLVEDCDGLLGMQYFRDTVMVLDFDGELLWVKSLQS